jgi:hypothetical protein
MNTQNPIKILVDLMDEIQSFNYTGSFKKECISQLLQNLLKAIEKNKYNDQFFRFLREGKDFFDYIEYKDIDHHRTDRRHLDNLEDDIQMEIERHRDEKIECDVVKYVKDTLHDYTYYIRKYYDASEISRRITEYFEEN